MALPLGVCGTSRTGNTAQTQSVSRVATKLSVFPPGVIFPPGPGPNVGPLLAPPHVGDEKNDPTKSQWVFPITPLWPHQGAPSFLPLVS